MASKPILRILPLVGLLVALPFAAKAMVLDPIHEKENAEALLAAREAELSALEQRLEAYDGVYEAFQHNRQDWMAKEEMTLFSRDDALAMVYSRFHKAGKITHAAVNGNVLTLELHGAKEETIQSILTKLEKNSQILSTSLYKLTPKTAQDVAWFISIRLNGEVG